MSGCLLSGRTLLLGAFLLLFASVIVAERCQEEIPLPKVLDIHNNEYHTHGSFRAPLGERSEISFVLSAPSFFRFYMAEHDIVDMDVELLDSTSSIVDLSMSVWGEEMLAAELEAGSYTIVFTPFIFDEKADRDNMCESLTLEITISSVEATNARISKLPEYDETFIPPVSTEIIDSYLKHGTAYHYDSTKDEQSDRFNVKVDTSSEFLFGSSYLTHWTFQLKPKPGTNPLYDFEASLGYNFLTSGNLRLLLDNSNDTKSPLCELSVADEGQCKRGTSIVENSYVIQTKLGPGFYTLWLLEDTDKRLTSVRSHPFSLQLALSQIHGEESFLSCAQQFLPDTLNSPGLIDATGFLHFRDDVLLDLSKESQTVTFSVPSNFLFRVWTDQHRVDIDIILKVKGGAQLARTFKTSGEAESIIAQGQAEVEYELTFNFYGRYDNIFCESFLLELLIQPLTPYYEFDYCGSASAVKPAITPLKDLKTKFNLPRTEYRYLWNSTRHDDVIIEIPISTKADMFLRANLEAHFLSGLDMTIATLVPEGKSYQRRVTHATTSRGASELNYFLEAGLNHTFVFRAGPHSGNLDISSHPACAFFAFQFDITPVTLASTMSMCSDKRLPKHMDGPSYFGSSNRVHFQEVLTIPPVQSPFEAVDVMTFTVRERSLFRAFTESRVMNGQDLDIDFVLREDGRLINHEVEDYSEEKFTYVLKPGKAYEFSVLFFADFSLLAPCTSWNIEWEVAPLFEDSTPTCTVILPETYPIVVRDLRTEFTKTGTYAFEQTAEEILIKLPIVIERSTTGATELVYFRAVVSYDFVWSDLALRLVDGDDTVVALGQNLFNKNEIVALQLSPGNYTLELLEPQALEQEELHHCTEFSLSIGIAPHASNQIQLLIEGEEEPCPFIGFPSSWNSAGGLSVLTDYTLHDARRFRKHGQNTDSVDFTIVEDSYFRAFIPPLDLFDVDIYLYHVKADSELETLERGVAYHKEENIFRKIEAGNYRIVFKYYFFPDDESCLTFPAEIGVISQAHVNKYLSLDPTLCSTSTPVLPPLVFGEPSSAQYFRKTTEEYKQSLHFVVEEPSVFTASISYSFFTGHLFFRLNGYNISSPYLSTPKDKVIYAYVGENIAFFDHLLYPGAYELLVDDEFKYESDTTIPTFCTRFTLDYLLKEGSPENYCDDADTLPVDLYTPFGGSKYFGGPQKADGSVRISGQHFVLPEYRSHTDISFRIKEPSWFRAWAKFDKDDSDVDFLLWKDKTKTVLVSAAAGISAVESHSAFLAPADEPYVLDLFVYTRVPEDCRFFHFELSIETNTTVSQDLICPDPLPSPALPPATIVANDLTITIFRETNVFTSDYITRNKKHYWLYDLVDYEMEIVIPGPDDYLLFAIVGYDFVLMDMELKLLDVNRTVIDRSEAEIPPFTDDLIDFESFLQRRLIPGEYTLVISEKIYSIEEYPRVSGTCDKFSFLLGLDSVGSGDSAFRVDRVLPAEATELDAAKGLVIEVTFTHPLGTSFPSTGLLQWVRNNKVFYLEDSSNISSLLFPTVVTVKPGRGGVTLTFHPLVAGHTYTLKLTATFLKDEQNKVIQSYNEIHTYTTFSCVCGPHGHCVDNEDGSKCVCDSPYTGPECNACEIGYHKSHLDCVANRACTANYCNGHGTCNDESGYPICACDLGYESDDNHLCTLCAHGYVSEKGVCIRKDDERSTQCTVPILPSTLDSVAHLGVNGKVHIQGDYYIDLVHTEHNLRFTLAKESYLRVYAEPHEVDIDLWLSRVDGDQTQLIRYSISFNEEETIFERLQPGEYVLNFQFLVLKGVSGECHSFNFELAIAPVNEFQNDVNVYKNVCKAADHLPNVDMGVLPVTKFQWGNDDDIWTVNSLVNEDGKQRDFWSRDFEVPRNEGTSTLIFQLHLGYRFLTGDIAVRLERTDAQEVDRSGNRSNKVVGFGYNGFNQHNLLHYIQEGQYKLVLYLPITQNKTVSPCTPFTLSINTSWKTKEEDIFSCPHAKLPTDFNSPTLADSADVIRVMDNFLVEGWSNFINFTVTQLSTLRVDATSKVPLQFELNQKYGTGWRKISSDVAGELFVSEIPAGNYQILFYYAFLDELVFCPTLDLEFVLRPKNHVQDSLTTFNCPGGHVSTIPALPTRLSLGTFSLPYTYSSTTLGKENVYYAFPELGGVVAEWDLVVADDVYLDITVGSYFITSNIRADLVSSNGFVQLRSDSVSFNNNRLVAELQPDTYKLRLTQFENSGTPLVTCSPFTFSLYAEQLGNWRQRTFCEDLTVLEIPTTLDSLNYLGFDGSVKIQNNNWLVPVNVSSRLLVENETFLHVKERSLIRIYIEEHMVDIDVELYLANADGTIIDISAPLVTGANGFGEESFVKTVEPGFYVIKLLFWNWENAQTPCLTFDMQLAISPVSQLPVRAKKCTTSRSHENLWPSIPSSLKKENGLPFVKEFSGYFQQSDVAGFEEHSYAISINYEFDIHLELGYNFLVGDLVLQFRSADKSFTAYGDNENTRNVFNAKHLPAGDYSITIYEATSNDADAVACSDFDFFMFVDESKNEVVEVERTDSGWLPTDLNTIPYLLYSNELKLHEQAFLVFSSGVSTVAKTITFQLKVASLFHLVIDGGQNSAAPFLVNLEASQPKTDNLLKVLQPGSYTINLYSNRETPRLFGGSISLANIHLSIQPYETMKTEVSNLCSVSKTRWVPDEVAIRDTDGYYHYREPNARLDSRQVTITGDLYTIPFEVEEDSIISVQVYYEFLWGDLRLSLTNDAKTSVHRGNNDFNSNDLQAFLTPGKYQLVLSQPLGWPADIDYHLPCSEFFIRFSITAADSGADRVDCSAYATFPWDLMSPTGGSADFGGPMQYGKLNLWSNKFLMNGDGTELVSAFSISEPSLISLFISQPSWNDLSAVIDNSDTQVAIAPFSEHHSWYQQVSLFKVDQTRLTNFDIALSYLPSSWTSCAQFSLGLAIAPIKEIERQLQAACTGPHQLPPTTMASNVYQGSSYFTNQDISSHTSGSKGFAYNMDFSITENTELDVALTYNPLYSFYVLRVYASRGGATDSWNLFSEGSWNTVAEEDNTHSFTQVIDVRLDKRYPKYRLAIEQTKPLLTPASSSQTFCYPFNFVFQMGSGNQPFVRYVEPTQGDNLNSERDFYVEVRFSDKLFISSASGTHQVADRTRATRDLLISYIYLQDTKTAEKKVYPVDVRAPEDNPGPDDGTRWMFTFSSKNLEYGSHYQLALAGGHLFDEAGKEMILRTVHNYTMSEFESRCNGHGSFNEITKKCICNVNEHRTGAACSECDTGFYEQDGKCVRPVGCDDRSCGCGPSSTASHCVPLGVCSPSTDPAHPEAITCSCDSPKYTGDRCEKCAVGYSNYPMCTQDKCDPPCEHGTCTDAGTCKCKDNWDGPTCNVCAPGFSGSNCETENGIMKVVGMIVVVLIVCAVVAVGVWYYKFRRVTIGDDVGLVTNEEILMEGIGQKQTLDSGSDSDSSSLGSSSGSWDNTKNVQASSQVDSAISSDSDDEVVGGSQLL